MSYHTYEIAYEKLDGIGYAYVAARSLDEALSDMHQAFANLTIVFSRQV